MGLFEMKNLRSVIALLALTMPVLATGQPSPTATDGYVAMPSAGATTAMVSASISNPTMYDIYVVSASSDAAESAEFQKEGKRVDNVTVPSFGSEDLKAGGVQLALVGLKRPLKAGDSVDITFMTDGGIAIPLKAVVK